MRFTPTLPNHINTHAFTNQIFPKQRHRGPQSVAFVTALALNQSNASDAYLLSALVAVRSIKAHWAQRSDRVSNTSFLFLILGRARPEVSDLVQREEITLLSVPSIPDICNNISFARSFHQARPQQALTAAYLAKLHALALTEFDRVVFFDADTIARSEISSFVLSSMSTAFTGCADPFGPLNSGLFSVKPSRSAWADLIDTYCNEAFNQSHGWGLSGPTRHTWRLGHGGLRNDWAFYGANIDQGLLYDRFFVRHPHNRSSTQNVLMSSSQCARVVAHFMGSNKPSPQTAIATLARPYRQHGIAWLAYFHTLLSRYPSHPVLSPYMALSGPICFQLFLCLFATFLLLCQIRSVGRWLVLVTDQRVIPTSRFKVDVRVHYRSLANRARMGLRACDMYLP